ncbi:LysR substrate-binding domain-containing protein [Nitrospirillum iridis]|uniref:DNA-binding transcriptional LysR family regulator n=1 Tax=Nitrospirillum iridis TaxID=765888 RepID=A0A7X0B5E7_9PROT|nr:LysR substrate-binding domain-containing protein [Nitrospirillum iridis]MBB6255326.1 DNA-binding transcriptional LysR family regulator [Nitrospirillum iridis]
MLPTNLDMDVLRTLVVSNDLGSFAKAAIQLGRTQPALSLQMRKLEEQIGVPLFRKNGRHMSLTDTGVTVLHYARRILALNDEVLVTARGGKDLGIIRLGLPQDLAESWMPGILARFQARHPDIPFEVQVGWWEDLRDRVQEGKLDLALAFGDAAAAHSGEVIGHLPLQWIASSRFRWDRDKPLSLVLPDAPCTIRDKCFNALNAVRIPWRIAFSSYSLTGVMGAVEAELGISARTTLGTPSSLVEVGSQLALPVLPHVPLTLFTATGRRSATLNSLLDVIKDSLMPPPAELPQLRIA